MDQAAFVRDETANQLVQRIATGDRHALAVLFQNEAGRMLAIAYRIVRRNDLAEEVVQDSFVAVWQRAGQFDPARGSARGWLTVIVRNRAINMLRDRSRLEFHDAESLADLGDRRADAMGAMDRLAANDALRHCLGQLDESKREAILLAYVVGMNHSEISTALTAPLGTVKAWIRRGTVALQECLQ